MPSDSIGTRTSKVHEKEAWLPVPGYHFLCASTDGRLKRYVWGKWRVVTQRLLRGRYMIVSVKREDGRQHTTRVHRLVALAFHGPCPAGKEVDHRDDNKQNNRPDNLQYLTRLENMQKAFATGRCVNPAGERARHVRFTTADIGRMKQLRADGWTLRRIADEFRTTESYVCEIMKGRYRSTG